MRISDWSSDVCSSDLFKLGQAVVCNPYGDGLVTQVARVVDEARHAANDGTHRDRHDRNRDQDLDQREAGVPGCAFHLRASSVVNVLRPRLSTSSLSAVFTPGPATSSVNPEIGRASGRDRGWQYVEVSVVAGTIK